jgi:hypothetical protein
MLTFDPDPVPFDDTVVIPYKDADKKQQHWKLRPGILLSECGFVHVINTAAEHKRLKIEVEALTTLKETRDRQWVKAELGYQDTIVKLQDDLRKANSPSFWETYDGPIMFGAGIVATALVFWGTIELYSELNKGR